MSWVRGSGKGEAKAALAGGADAQASMVAKLRAKLESEAGRAAAHQLVQGGELSDAEQLTSDAYLRRWLRARDWQLELTHSCIINHAGWRAHMLPHGHIDEAWVQAPIADQSTLLQGVDRQGRALLVIRVRNHVPRKSKADFKALKLFVIYAVNAAIALCDTARNPGCRLVSVFDLTGAGVANLDVAGLRMILGLLHTHFIETLDLMVFFNPPSIFWSIWNTFKPMMPAATRAKIRVMCPADVSELRADVPDEVLPAEYGGKAQPLLLPDAVRRFELPPWPHVPGMAGIGGVPESEPSTDASDEAFYSADEAGCGGDEAECVGAG